MKTPKSEDEARGEVDAMSLREVLDADGSIPYDDPRRSHWRRRKEQVDDELAEARVVARRGLPPLEHWREVDDPRRQEWAKIHAESLDVLVAQVRDARREFSGDDLDPAKLVALLAAAEKIVAVVTLIRGAR